MMVRSNFKVTLDYTHNGHLGNTAFPMPAGSRVYAGFGFLRWRNGRANLDGAKFVIKQGDRRFKFNDHRSVENNQGR